MRLPAWDVALMVLDEVLGPDGYQVLERVQDGTRLEAGQCLLKVQAPTRGLLTAERTLLNLVCHLSGIATATAAWVGPINDPVLPRKKGQKGGEALNRNGEACKYTTIEGPLLRLLR